MSTPNYCELEFSIHWLDRGKYYVVGKFSDPLSDRENYILDGIHVEFDLDQLRELTLNADAYGAALTEMVFGMNAGPIRDAYVRAREAASTRDGLRIRLTIQTSAPELHAVRWETIRDPTNKSPLLTQGNVWFSRFVGAQDFRLRPLPDQDYLQALVVVSNPTDIETKWRQPALDPDAEYSRAVAALAPPPGGRAIAVTRLDGTASLYNIVSSLRNSYSDVLYLACHGTLTQDGEARMLLETDTGTGEMAKGEQLVERLGGMNDPPRLVVLASCMSAGNSDGVALTAIGPRLVQAGVASVVAMQGDITFQSADKFMRRLFIEIARDGQIDRAVAVARNDIRDEPDWWQPTLFTRSRTGSLWPRRPTDDKAFDLWEAVVTDLGDKQCVPVLGPGLVEGLFGSRRNMARQWAERYEFPLAPQGRDDVSQVAQYLAYRQSQAFALQELRSYLASYIRKKFKADLPADLMTGPVEVGLVNKLVSEVGALQRRRNVNDVHRLLARLPVRMYVSANRDNLLRDALIEAGRAPRIQLCTWRATNDMPLRLGPPLDKKYEPSEQEPLVFQVFGNMEWQESQVLTEDDYFSFLTAVTRYEALEKMSIPTKVSRALASSGLLLLGFHVDDWDFRVLLRSVLKQPGELLAQQRTRVAIQMNPSEAGIVDSDRAAQYLGKYFERQVRTSIFWGTPDEFMVKLINRCIKAGHKLW